MAILDNPNNPVSESSVPFWPTALRFGLIGGLVFVAYSLIANLLGFSIPTSLGKMALQFLLSITITVLIIVFTVRQHRDQELGGYITFGRAFLVGFVALLIASVINSLFSMLYMTVIDPGFAEAAIEGTEEMMRSMGLDDEAIEKAMEDTRDRMNPTSMVTQALIWGSVMSAIFAAIVGAIMKKQAPVV